MATLSATLCKESTLLAAYNTVRRKGSAGGIDGVSIADFEKEKRNLIPQIAQSLKNRTWMPHPYLQERQTSSIVPSIMAMPSFMPVYGRHYSPPSSIRSRASFMQDTMATPRWYMT